MAGAFQTDAFQDDAFQVAVAVKTGGGITIQRRPRIFDEPPTRVLEPVASPAIATFWSIAVIDWVIPLAGALGGRGWVRGVASWNRSLEASPLRAGVTMRGSVISESAEFRLRRQIETEDEELLVGV